MIVHPENYAERFIDAGADIITFHFEACDDPEALIDKIHARGVKAAVSIKPATPASAIFHLLDKVDMILVMTVEPGYGGQSLIPEMLDKVREVRAEIERRGKAYS
jgi:ribulose-phosphate 3-epimerase